MSEKASAGFAVKWVWLAVGLVAALLPFWCSDLDLTIASRFYDAGNPDNPWPYQDHWLWFAIYKGDWMIATLFALASIGAILVSHRKPSLAIWRPRGWFLLLVMVLGSGLVVNAIFKDHWGRFRPRQVEQLGGVHQYVPPLAIGTPGEGKAFPCGHCSVAFAFFGFWFIWRRRRPRLAWAMFAFAAGLGALVGVARLTAGAHFPSDTLWSGILMFATAWLVYHHLLNVPKREASIEQGRATTGMSRSQQLGMGLLAVLVVFGLMFTKPMADQHRFVPQAEQLERIQAIHLNADRARIRLMVEPLTAGVDIASKTHSFGLPVNKLVRSVTLQDDGQLIYVLVHEGVYTELDTELRVRIDPDWLDRLWIQLGQGDIHVPESNTSFETRFKIDQGEIRVDAR